MLFRHRSVFLTGLTALAPVAALAAALQVAIQPSSSGPASVEFNRDVRPILSDNCFYCHGNDPNHRKGKLRLDIREEALKKEAFVPGKPDESELIKRIISSDTDELMPPVEAHKKLTEQQKDVLKRWIAQGAKYQKHWSFEPPRRAPLPQVQDKAWIRNPIDAYVLGALEKLGLKPAPEADRRTLARRVALDITGLPPTPDEVDAFVADTAPDAYERLIDKLMARPQWGEHRGRYWLDAARYADTHGLHFDKYREIWPYRDWVIGAFNRNERFDQFTIEQLAGDLLPHPTRDQLIATGFHRCNTTTNEGGTIDEENMANYASDRVTTTAWVWLGLTANCAQCHDHKFDPVTMHDFYSMAAYFRNTTQPPKDGNVKDTKPVIYLPVAADEKRFAELPKVIADARGVLAARRPDAAKDFEIWLQKAKPEQVEVSPEALVVQLPLDENSVDVRAEVGIESATFKATGPIEWADGGRFGKAPAFTNGAHFNLGDLADFDSNQPFSVGTWVRVPENFREGAVVARMDDRKGVLQGWELFVQAGKFGLQLAPGQAPAAIRAISKNPTVRAGKWQHVLATYDGSGKPSGFRLFVDGRVQPVVTAGNALKGSTRAAVPLRIGQRETKYVFQAGQVQDVRVYARELSTGEARSLPEEANLRAAFATIPEKRTPAQKAALLNFYIDNLDGPSISMAYHIEDLEDEDAAIKDRATVSHIQEEKPGEPVAHVLMRGAYDKEGEEVHPAGFSALHAMPAEAPRNRLGLARWIMSPENPLTARVTVNRYWQEVFGVGLVRTTEDFGSQGERPSNQELLDWLAVEFRESGWDVKHLFKLIFTSATYRQAAIVTPEKLEKDPQNRMLSRGPRFRMDAEMIRDYALAASGTLSPKMGGPGTKPYQPENIWEVVGLQTERYSQDKGENLYRRTIYNFWKRMAPSPNMEVFNAPTREACVVRRERTNTPLQALVTLNDPQFVEAARRMAEKAAQDCAEPAGAIARMASRVLLRPLTSKESEVLVRTEEALEQDFAANPENAKEYLSVGETKPAANIPAPRLAALAMIGSELLNLDEALNK